MVVPAIIYSTLLFAAYISGLGFYFVGILMTAASLARAPQMTFHIPHGMHHVYIDDDRHHHHFEHDGMTIDISDHGIHIKDNDPHHAAEDGIDINIDQAKTPDLPAIPTPPANVAASQPAATPTTSATKPTKPLRSEGIPVVVGNHLGMLDIFRGLGLIFGGIALFLFALFMTKMTFVGFKQYVSWNMSLLHLSDKK
jgi:hypothetical protein